MAWNTTLSNLLRAPLRRLIAAWVELRLIEPLPERLALDPECPTLYVLPHPALSDTLLLETLCARHDLPSPSQCMRFGDLDLRASVPLPTTSRRFGQRSLFTPPFTRLIEYLATHPDEDIQLVPVSVFWGRAPGKRFGLWKLLAADSWQLTGHVRRALSVIVNGKNVELHFGAPLHLKALLDDRPSEVTNRKVARLLRVHFRRARTRVLGPDLSHRRTLIDGVVGSPAVRQAIVEVADAEGLSRARIEKRAWRYGREIASDMSYPVLRFMDSLLEWLWNRLYDGVEVRGLESVKALAGEHTLVYVPCHRSHIDYLLLSYVLYRDGLMPPHIAAGHNLDMPLVGSLLRHGGAFFMRRSFKDNRLYGAVFNEYLHRLLSRGHPLEYFIEGGRSRSGRMLSPRPGMLSMSLRSHARLFADATGHARGMVFVPVYIGYEKVLESATYLRELKGYKKRKESPLGLIRVLGQLRQPFGRVAVNIGEPLHLDAFLDHHTPQWRRQCDLSRPPWLNHAVPLLGIELARRINDAAALNAINLVALVLLTTPHRAIETRVLIRQLALLVALQRRLPGGRHTSFPDGKPEEWVTQAASLGFIERRDQALGELVLADAAQASLLGWYRNNVLHLFALAGLTAFAFRNNTRLRLEELLDLLAPSWPVLCQELFISTPRSLESSLRDMLEALVEQGLLEYRGDAWKRPNGQLEANEQLQLLGGLVQPTLERGFLLLTTLLRQPSGSLSREDLIEQSRQLAERLALLSGLEAPEFFDARLFTGLIDSLHQEGWLWLEQDRVHYGQALEQGARKASALFDPALRQRLLQISTPQPAQASSSAR
ncbi:glycerol-3-phosphate acyltransferase [Litchfieldella qijiaojingensis]|uniref:Glycerol-3-phosphate acyltransferase n=1 Tax=Litchfieldella qijiaojingensis TaxID=980347 RepID=A0ABQ2ZAF3_9GAMM|nr:glycerol-3-phosphate 1-O-acyltransferase PlsB [Halomonas qijiaojingensis]GGY08724.1 glycerol-3-phosphate acyltransferase [Halomonas qijiaojingensis]